MDDYVTRALRTESNDLAAIRRQIEDPRKARLLHAALGLTTEAGEFADAIKAAVFYRRKIDPTNLIEELGDLLWYIAIASDVLDVPLSEIMERNIAKLRQRYPQGFAETDANERNLGAERDQLVGERQQIESRILGLGEANHDQPGPVNCRRVPVYDRDACPKCGSTQVGVASIPDPFGDWVYVCRRCKWTSLDPAPSRGSEIDSTRRSDNRADDGRE